MHFYLKNARRALCALALIALALAAPSALAEKPKVGDRIYGEWSEWQNEPIQAADDLEVRTSTAKQINLVNQWSYERYAYVDAAGEKRYAPSAADAVDAAEGSIERETLLSAEQLAPAGEVAGEACYAGQWFHEAETPAVEDVVPVTQYSARDVEVVQCVLSQSSIGLGLGEHYQLGAEFLYPMDNHYWISSDQDVASVDKNGGVTAYNYGSATISVLSDAGVIANCEVLVGDKRVALQDGYYALRLDNSRLSLNLITKDYVPSGVNLKLEEAPQPQATDAKDEKQDEKKAQMPPTQLRFQLKNVGDNAFQIRPIYSTIAYVGLQQADDGAVEAGNPIKVHAMQEVLRKKNERAEAERARRKAIKEGKLKPEATPAPDGAEGEDAADEYEIAWTSETNWQPWYWYALRCGDGTYVLYSQTDESIVLGAQAAGEGAALEGQQLDPESRLQRWTLEADPTESGKGIFWEMPVEQDGICFISDEFINNELDKHDGIDIASISRRIPIQAVAAGRVIRVKDTCTHDYRKTETDKNGKYVDPCSSAPSYGKYIMIQHEDGTISMYAHLSKISVKRGQTVKQGQTIGRMGTTGSSSGIHLHLEAIVGKYEVDPRVFLEFPKKGERLT